MTHKEMLAREDLPRIADKAIDMGLVGLIGDGRRATIDDMYKKLADGDGDTLDVLMLAYGEMYPKESGEVEAGGETAEAQAEAETSAVAESGAGDSETGDGFTPLELPGLDVHEVARNGGTVRKGRGGPPFMRRRESR